MDIFSVKGTYRSPLELSHITTEINELQRRYQHHKGRWTIYVNHNWRNKLFVQIQDHDFEIPRGKKPTMYRIYIKLQESSYSTIIRYNCRWPLCWYVLPCVFPLLYILFVVIAGDLADTYFFLPVILALEISIYRLYRGYLRYKNESMQVFDEILRLNFFAEKEQR